MAPQKNHKEIHHHYYPQKKKVNWVLTLVMSILFGGIGVDRFIMGHVGLGLLKLVTFGGCGIWWLIDVILIATKHPFNNVEWIE
jgi:TM2 domain-containing membrane protein YozV